MNCQYAIVSSQIKTHSQVRHKCLGVQQRHDIISKVESLAELATIPRVVIYLEPIKLPVAIFPFYLGGPKGASIANHSGPCPYMCRMLHLMQEHCKQQHDWANQHKRGDDGGLRRLHMSNKIWTENHGSTRELHPSGALGRYLFVGWFEFRGRTILSSRASGWRRGPARGL